MKNTQNQINKQVQRILLFAGTTEGRLLAEFFGSLLVELYVCTATEYGRECIEKKDYMHVLAGRMDEDQISSFLQTNQIDLVVDATHPFALEVTENIRQACNRSGVTCFRCLREGERLWEQDAENVVLVDSVREAVQFLKETRGNILIATGSKELKLYTAIPDFQKRCYARVLSTKEAVEECVSLGFQGAHLIAMQGPFSKTLNEEMLNHTKAVYFVTKQSGKTGGFEEKMDAAKAAGAILVVVERPKENGKSMEEIQQIICRLTTPLTQK